MKIFTYLPGITTEKMDGYESIDLSEIGEINNSSCDEVFVGDCLDFIEQRTDFGTELIKKIAYGGTITIVGVDVFEMSRAVEVRQIDLPAINAILYNHRCSISSVGNVVSWVRQLGLNVISQRVSDFKYTVIAKRPLPQ